ncbi:MAG: hypothetical protein ABSE83_06700 [Methanobacterium sp.]
MVDYTLIIFAVNGIVAAISLAFGSWIYNWNHNYKCILILSNST